MIEIVNVLMSVLFTEGILLVLLNITSLLMVIKEMLDNKEPLDKFISIMNKFRGKVYSNEKCSYILKSTVVLYGVTKLTALWCFTILLGIAFTLNEWAVIGILIIEILFIALQVRNKFILEEKDVMNIEWLLIKLECAVQKKVPSFSMKDGYENLKGKLSSNKLKKKDTLK